VQGLCAVQDKSMTAVFQQLDCTCQNIMTIRNWWRWLCSTVGLALSNCHGDFIYWSVVLWLRMLLPRCMGIAAAQFLQ
jgi:hypothetical protein